MLDPTFMDNNADVLVMQVIRTRLPRMGSGKDKDDTIRVITHFWSMKGELLAQIDPFDPYSGTKG